MYQPKLRKQRNGIPILRNCEIDTHAEALLQDYNPLLLDIPQPVNIEEFAEYYLKLTLDFTYLSHCGLILGRMIFQETERVPVYLPEEGCADYLYAKKGTILIDNTVLEDRREYRLRSTIGHECGHWIFHSDFYSDNSKKRYQLDTSLSELTGCKKKDIEGVTDMNGRRKLVSDLDWLEHHAKYFSAAILMPKTPFMKAVSDLLDNGQLDEAELAEKLSCIFQVSPISANIRLSQLDLNASAIRKERTQDERQFKQLLQIPGTL